MWGLERKEILMKKENNSFKLEVVSIRLVKDAPLLSGYPISKPEDAVALLGEYLCDMDREMVCVINLRSDGIPINCHFASMGAVNESMTHPRELFKSSILSNAESILILHNHPSGNLLPSKSDTMVTDRMVRLGELIGIPVTDHIIVGGDNSQYFSFKEKEILPTPHIILQTNYEMVEFESPPIAEKGRGR